MVERPVPTPHADSAPYWEGCAAGELRLQHCSTCGEPRFYPRARCPFCFSGDADWKAVTGRGSIYSYTVVRRAMHPWFAERVPYVVALIALDEGPRLMSHVLADPETIRIGQRVHVVFDDAGSVTLPMFELTEERQN